MSESMSNLILMIESKREQFTDVEQIIANYFVAHQEVRDINGLAKKLAVSPSSITRFSHKIGLSNYKELVFLYKEYLGSLNRKVSRISSDVVDSYRAIAQRTSDRYDEQTVQLFCERIFKNRIIFFWGLGFNSFVGLDFEFRFARFGKIVQHFSDQQSISLNANFLKKGDTLLISSISAKDKSILKSIETAKARGAHILLITANHESAYLPYCDGVMYTASFSPEESLGNISPQVPALIDLDIIYSKYIDIHQHDLSQWAKSENILKNWRKS